MKMTQVVNLFAIASALSLTGIGCQTSSVPVTHLPTSGTGVANNQNENATPIIQDPAASSSAGHEQPDPSKYGGPKDDKIFAAYMVHFDYDSPSVKSTEKSK